MLRKEILFALDVYDSYGITEDEQRRILKKGIYFDFTYGDPDYQKRNVEMDYLEFAKFLNICKAMGIEIDINHLLNNLYDGKYENLIRGLKLSGIL